MTNPVQAFDTDVLIVGAGPAGLTLAAALAARQIRITVIDRQAEGANTSRAAVVHAVKRVRVGDGAVLVHQMAAGAELQHPSALGMRLRIGCGGDGLAAALRVAGREDAAGTPATFGAAQVEAPQLALQIARVHTDDLLVGVADHTDPTEAVFGGAAVAGVGVDFANACPGLDIDDIKPRLARLAFVTIAENGDPASIERRTRLDIRQHITEFAEVGLAGTDLPQHAGCVQRGGP